MSLTHIRWANLLVSGLLAGNEFGSKVAVHPALETLIPSARSAAEQALYRRYGRVMPALMTLAIATGVCALPLLGDRRSAAYRLTAAGTACQTAMLAITLVGNIPLNRRILAFDPADDPGAFRDLRLRWERLHTVRVTLDVAGFGLLCAGMLVKTAATQDNR